MKIWHQKAIFKPEKGKLSTWLITLCRNRAIDILRQRKDIAISFLCRKISMALLRHSVMSQVDNLPFSGLKIAF